jgi:hypothetical protein
MILEAAAAVFVHKNITGGDCLAVRNGAKPVGDEGVEHRVHRGRNEIGGVCLSSKLEHTLQLFM